MHNAHLKFDKNRSSSFGDYRSNKNLETQQTTDGQTDRQTETSDCRGHERSKKRTSRESIDGLNYNKLQTKKRTLLVSVVCHLKKIICKQRRVSFFVETVMFSNT